MPTTDQPQLLPCPFCGAGTSELHEAGRMWTGRAYGEPSSVSVRHWCEPVEGQPSRMIERIGRDPASAIAAWNLRAPASADAEIQRLTAALTKVNEQAERFERGWYLRGDALEKIGDWAKAYPASAFPALSTEDWARAASALSDAGINLDRISAANMLHVITRAEKIAQEGLKS